MGSRNICLTVALIFAVSLLFVSAGRAQVDVGDYRVSGSGEFGGLPRSFNGRDAKFEEYRDIPESVIVPELQLMIGAKKEDFYFNFDSSKLGRDDQNYLLRFGRYGLLDMEFEWKQFPHLFSDNVARSPYNRSNDGGDNTLAFKPTATTATANCATSPICQFLNNHATPVTLSLFNGIGKFNLRYTPNPGWTFTGSYWSNHNTGDRALGAVFASNPGSYIFTEQREPMDYQTHNIELGGEYAAKDWSIGLKYNASLFHNGVSTLTWDNPLNLSNSVGGTVVGACSDSATWTPTSNGTDANRGPCRGRLDLYPSNQAHTITLTGAANLPLKTHFMGTASYGWRLQNDSFLPATINTALAPLAISDRGLGGNVNPTTVNLSVVNNAIDKLNLKANYRFYDLNDNSRNVTLTGGWYINDQGTPQDVGDKITRLGYSKNNIGLEAGYNFLSWLTGKFAYGWERMHRDEGNVVNSNEHTIGPTVDIKPMNGVLLRALYKHSWRDAPDYNNNRLDPGTDIANISRKFYQAKRDRDRVSLFADVSPWETVGLHAGFEFTGETYPDSTLGTQNDFNFSPSVGFVYSPLDWLRFFGDYNFDLFNWRLDSMQRSVTDSTQDPNNPACTANCQLRLWNSKGNDKVHTFSLGSDVDIIKNLLGFRLQYTFSQGVSAVSANGATCTPLAPASGGCTQASDYPNVTNTWHELLARFQYQIHKNIALRFGYYFNKAREKDYGVDIMKPWMGDVIDPQASATALAQLQRSIWLGDQIKGSFTAHVGFITVGFKF